MAHLRSVWLQELTWEDVADYLKSEDIIIFPIGSTEQHGPAGPLGVDSYAAIALAEDAAKETGVLVTPPLWFGDSPHHLDFPGTISLRTETLTEVAKDVIRSLARHGFKKIIVLNGHKGTNLAGLTTACRSLHQYELPDVLLALVDPMFLAKGIAQIKEAVEHHAGELEISHVWYKHPHLIKKEKLTRQQIDLEPILSPFAHQDLSGKERGYDRGLLEQPGAEGVHTQRLVLRFEQGLAGEGKRIPRVHGEEPGEVHRLAPPV